MSKCFAFDLKSYIAYRQQMGPASTKAREQHPPSAQHPEQTFVVHPRFNNLKITTKATEQQDGVVQIAVALPAESQFTKWQKKVQELGQLESVYLPVSHRYQKTEFCGSGGIAQIQYNNYPYLLSDQINNRKAMENKHFQEAELWYLIFSIVTAADSFHSRSAKLGDVRPQNVFISHSGQVQVACQHTWPNEQTNYLKTVFEKQLTYLAPEELKDINYGKLDNQGSTACLSESFSVGLTCFDAAQLSNSTALYQNGNKFNYTLLEQQFNAFEQSRAYSQPLVLLLKGLCQVQPSKRVDCRQIAAWLRKYQQFINELQEFKFEQVPDKLLVLRPAPKSSNVNSQHYVSVPQNVGIPRQSMQRPREVINPAPQQIYYSGSVPMVQSLYGDVGNSRLPYTTVVQNSHLLVNQGINGGSNANPSVITFQKDPRSAVMESGISYPQSRGINLQQIDQQLELSRKMFPN